MPGRSRFLGIARRYRPCGHLQTRCRRLISRGSVCWCGRIFRRCVRLGGGGGRRFFLCRSCWGGRGWLGCRRIWAWDGFWEKFGGAFAAFAWQKSAVALLAFALRAQACRAMADIRTARRAVRMEAGGVEPRGAHLPTKTPI